MRKLILLVFIGFYLVGFSQNSWVKISAGGEFSMAIASNGTLWSWGYNANGQLGIGNTTQQSVPVQIGTDNNWSEIDCGAIHTLALKTDGTLWSWGLNGNGQLGLGNNQNKNIPTLVNSDTDWSSISAGQVHNLAIKNDGSLWSWGSNFNGNLGIGTTTDSNVPVRVGLDTDWQKITTGGGHSLAIKTDGTLWSTGANGRGQCGVGTSLSNSPFSTNVDLHSFQQIGSDLWQDISAGHIFTTGVKIDGTLWSWGLNGNGQLGFSGVTEVADPTQIGTSNNWKNTETGSCYAFALNTSDTLYGWGFNSYGCIGDFTNLSNSSPVFIVGDVNLIAGACGVYSNNQLFGTHSLLIKNSSNTVICATGSNYVNQLGNGNTSQSSNFQCQTGDQTNEIEEITNKFVNPYPNPFSNKITFNLQEVNEETKLSIFSMDGKLVFQTNIGKNDTFNWECNSVSNVFLYTIEGSQTQIKGKLIRE